MKHVIYYKNDGTQRITTQWASVNTVCGLKVLVKPVIIGPWGEFETAHIIYRPDRLFSEDTQ